MDGVINSLDLANSADTCSSSWPLPTVVTPFGGCCPDDDGEGDSIGFKPVRSQEEAAARDARRNRSRAYSSARQASLAASNEDGTQPSTRPNIARSNSEDTIASRELIDGIRVLRSRSFSHGAAEKGARMKDESQYESPIDDEEFMVRFDPGDPANPKNWSSLYRWYLTAAGSMLVLNSTFASSAPSGIVGDLERYFGFSQEVAVLTISLFVAGYCVGPLLWGPLSESYGRRPIFIIAYIFYIGFTVGCALSRNTASILIFRLLSGIFAACPLTNAGALLADIWDADRRGIAMAFFSLAPFAGPALGPIVGGFIFVTGTNWRWLFWVLTLFAGFCGLLILFTIPETYAPILLCHKAKEMRRETGQLQWWAPLEKAEKDLKDVARDILFKPFKILFAEPMLLAITVYMSFVYGCIYLLFEAYPIVFMEGHGFNAGVNGLMFLGLFIGGCLSTLLYLCFFNARYVKKAHHHAPEPTPPEYRLEPAMLCSPLFAIAFFWFGWTSYPSILWVSPCFAGGLLGFAVLGIFVSLFNYVSFYRINVQISGRATGMYSLTGGAFGIYRSSTPTSGLPLPLFPRTQSVDPSLVQYSHSSPRRCIEHLIHDGLLLYSVSSILGKSSLPLRLPPFRD